MDVNRTQTHKQLSLFDDKNCLRNEGILELTLLSLGEAKEAFERYRAFYPQGDALDVEIKITDFLTKGFRNAPVGSPDMSIYLYRLWESFEVYVKSLGYAHQNIVSDIKHSFFRKIVETIDQCDLASEPFLSEKLPTGYFYIQTGQYDLAIKSLQACIPLTPNNAAIYGYLGDTYLLREEPKVARQCYREACLIDPAGIDWHHIKNDDLLALRDELIEDYDRDQGLALEWLPSHALIEGLFELKPTKLIEELKGLVEEYLALEKAFLQEKRPELKARLFFRGILLCGNEQILRFIKKVSLIAIRKLMKDVNPDLFSRYLLFLSRSDRNV